MTYFLELFLFLGAPTIVICGTFYFAATFSISPVIRRVLQISALFWVVAFALIILLNSTAHALCTPTFFSYKDCTGIPEGLADFSFPSVVFGIYIGAIYMAGLALLAALTETALRWRRAKRPEPLL